MQRVDANYVEEVAREGFAVIENVLDADTIEFLIQDLATARINNRGSQRGGLTFLLHSSGPSINPQHRRVLHFEYASINLPDGLEWFE